MNPTELERYSSAFTLSDMEIFIFPDLLYSLVLANIMSPEIWKWRDDPWFAGIDKMGPLKKVHRVKQYIMDHYNFNLDLETWGLTDKETEIGRFREIIDPGVLTRSNALFGYEGDKYYFDIDIRRHFGLDKYDTDIIPYWKTETVEAMNAFRFKPGHEQGAGECVSLACLYAAALFIVARVPLEKIFLMGTPLHSQDYVLVDDGVLTNNRRIVTKQMWYNGTELSALARRALEHEQVNVVAHCSGHIHSMYDEATIDPEAYHLFRDHLTRFLETQVDFGIFINFLRDYSRHQKLFHFVFICHGTEKYIRLEKAFGYEHGSKNRLGDKNFRKLFCEMDEEDLDLHPMGDRAALRPDDAIFSKKPYLTFLEALLGRFPSLKGKEDFINDYKKFMHTRPRLPKEGILTAGQADKIALTPGLSREEIISHLSSLRSVLPDSRSPSHTCRHSSLLPSSTALVCDLAFYAGRYMDRCNWEPFLKAALERNPVSVGFFREHQIQEVYETLKQWPDESIYDGNRLSQPDEVVNFTRGDGIEKAITLANIIRSVNRNTKIHIRVNRGEVAISYREHRLIFKTGKDFDKLELLL